MRWRVMLELVGADGTVGVHQCMALAALDLLGGVKSARTARFGFNLLDSLDVSVLKPLQERFETA
jgi:hypothetical protein